MMAAPTIATPIDIHDEHEQHDELAQLLSTTRANRIAEAASNVIMRARVDREMRAAMDVGIRPNPVLADIYTPNHDIVHGTDDTGRLMTLIMSRCDSVLTIRCLSITCWGMIYLTHTYLSSILISHPKQHTSMIDPPELTASQSDEADMLIANIMDNSHDIATTMFAMNPLTQIPVSIESARRLPERRTKSIEDKWLNDEIINAWVANMQRH